MEPDECSAGQTSLDIKAVVAVAFALLKERGLDGAAAALARSGEALAQMEHAVDAVDHPELRELLSHAHGVRAREAVELFQAFLARQG